MSCLGQLGGCFYGFGSLYYRVGGGPWTWAWFAPTVRGSNRTGLLEFAINLCDPKPVRSVVPEGCYTTVAGSISATIDSATTTPPPTAAFTHTTRALALTESFDASSSTGSISEWDWDFGDGKAATGTTVDHTFAHAGSFSVTLTVHATDGQTDAVTKPVTVGGFVVNSSGDDGDTHSGDDVCDTGGTVTDGAAECTLRAAIEETNALEGGGGGDQAITFAIPGDGVPTVSPQSALPAVAGTTTISSRTRSTRRSWISPNRARARPPPPQSPSSKRRSPAVRRARPRARSRSPA